jgi:hypothetical protein
MVKINIFEESLINFQLKISQVMKAIGFTFNDFDFVINPFQFAVMDAIITAYPDLCTVQIQIPDEALSPTVSRQYFLSAYMAYRVKALIGNNINKSFADSLIDHLLYNFYSTKGEKG